MRGFLIFLGLLLVLGGGAVAGAQYAPVDLSVLDSVNGAKAFLTSQMALYAGGGAAGFGLLLVIIAAATGGKKKTKPAKAKAAQPKADKAKAVQSKAAKAKPETAKAEPQASKATAEKAAAPQPAPRKAEPAPAATAPAATAPPPQPTPQRAPQPTPQAALQPAPKPAPQPAAVAPRPSPVAVTTPPPAPPPVHKPTASGQPPASAVIQDPRLFNRKRVQDLVTINDALKAYQQKHGAYPKAGALAGFPDRGAAWIPGLAPDFLKELPRDPAMSADNTGPQYVYVSDGANYKLLAQGVSLVGSTNVEVLGVRIDMTRQPTPENAAFGFWTDGFASA